MPTHKSLLERGYRQARRARGLCTDCTAPAMRDSVYCAHHREKRRAATRRCDQRRRQRATVRCCTVCGQPLAYGTRRSASRHAACGWKAQRARGCQEAA